MHTTWRAPVAWLLCFSARFVVLDTLLSSSLTPTTRLFSISVSLFLLQLALSLVYIYTHICSIFFSLSLFFLLNRLESFSLLPFEVLRSSVALTLSLFSLRLSLSRYSKYSSLAISFPLGRLNAAHSEERNELKSTHSSPASRSFSPSFPRRRPSTRATRSRSLEETRTLLSLPLSFGV